MGVCVCVMGEFELLLLLLLEMSAGIATWEAGEEAVRLSIVGSYRHHINFSPGGFHLTACKPDNPTTCMLSIGGVAQDDRLDPIRFGDIDNISSFLFRFYHL